MTAKEFVKEYWFEKGKPSKSVTTILNWIANGKLTPKGRTAYKTLLSNTNK